MNSNHPKKFCAKFGSNWPSSSREEDENVKSLQTDGPRMTGDKKSSLAFSSGELKTRKPRTKHV